jgi:hypothetical protein
MTALIVLLSLTVVYLLVRDVLLNIRMRDHIAAHPEVVARAVRALTDDRIKDLEEFVDETEEAYEGKFRGVDSNIANIKHDLQVALDCDAEMMKLIAAGQEREAYPAPAGSAPELTSQHERPLADRYNELLYAVGRKFPGESRHETALRYIRQEEKVHAGPSVRNKALQAVKQPKRKKSK